jgi:hypothetical protein
MKTNASEWWEVNVLYAPYSCIEYSKICPATGNEGPEEELIYSSTLFLTSALDGDWWLTSRPCRFNPLKEIRYPFYKRLVVFRDGLDECGITHPHRDSIAGPSSPYLVAIPTDLSWPIMPVHMGSYSRSKTKKFTFIKRFTPILLFMSPTCFGHFFLPSSGYRITRLQIIYQ